MPNEEEYERAMARELSEYNQEMLRRFHRDLEEGMGEVENVELRQTYGVNETNNLEAVGISHKDTDNSWDGDWTSPELARIIRIRLLGDPGPLQVLDVSYVLGELKDGRQVRVRVPFYQVSKRTYMKDMYKAATEDGINLNKLCGGHLRNVISRLV